MKFIVDDKIPYIAPYLERWGKCRYLPGAAITAEDVRDADVLVVRTRTKVNKALLAGSRIGMVVTATIGFDHIDADCGVPWTNCPGCNAQSVAQYIEAAIAECYPQGTPEELTLGIVGCGHVGSAVRAMAERHGWQLRLSDPPLGLCDDLSPCDVITFHTPLTHDGPCPTWHLADDDFFRRLQRRPVIINAARGGVVDEEALLRAMDAGLVGDVVIDTWETEPQPRPQLLQRARIATPHIAGYSANGKATATLMSLRAIAERCHLPTDHLPATALEMLQAALPADTLAEAQRTPYNPAEDSARLKADPARFEWLRGHYPLRLE